MVDLQACEAQYKATLDAYSACVRTLCKERFGSIRKAARAVRRSKQHIIDCSMGRRGIDSTRRLAHKLDATSEQRYKTAADQRRG